MKEFFNKTLPLNFIFCLCYFLLAAVGFEWGALTTNATLLWPPSGLAVFACLVFGPRVLPGLLLGAILSSESISFTQIPNNAPLSYLLGVIKGSSSILQAYVIARLSRNYHSCGFRVSTRAAFKFTVLVLMACTLAASISNFTLWQLGAVSTASAIQNWGIWWTGDAIGVLIITPLLLWIHHRKTFFRQSQENAFLIFSIGAGIVLLVAATVGHKERETFETNLVHVANQLQLQLQSTIDLSERDLRNLQMNSALSEPEQFQQNASTFLQRNTAFSSLSLVATIETATNPTAIQPLTLARSDTGELIWTAKDATITNQLVTMTLPTAPATDQLVAMWLEQKNIASDAIHFLGVPVYACHPNLNGCTANQLIIAALNLNTLMQTGLPNLSLAKVNLQLELTDSQQTKRYLQWSNNRWNSIADRDDIIANPVTNLSKKIPAVTLAGAEWKLLLGPKNVPSQLLPTLLQCGILLIGFCLVSLLSAYLQALFKHDQIVIENQEQLKSEIEQQTEALRTANDWLLSEMKAKRQAREQLETSEAHLRTLLDTIPDPVWLKSPEGTYISFNKAVTELFHREEKDVAGNKAGDYVDKELSDEVARFEQAALNSHSAVRRDLWMHIPSSNEHRLMDTIKIAMRDQNHTPVGILSVARDITEQHKLIDELEKFKRFAEFASEGFSIMSLAAETLYMNPSMQTMLLSNQNPSNKNFIHYFPNDLQTQWRDNILPYVLNKGYWQGELAALRADGSRFPTKATFFAIRDDKGQPLYIGEIMSDISEQKQIEKSLQLAKQTAEEATRAKSRFLANMSHEIRTPLNAVLGYSQLLMADTQLSAQQQERLHSILSAGQRLLHLINDILDLSKIEAGVLHFRQDYFDLTHELNDILSIMQTKAQAKALTLNSKITLPAPAIVKSDRQKIGQVILNLLGNAIKFTQAGEINLAAYAHESGICIEITDTGPGISAQELQSLFSAFKQGKAGEESGGTGLGLVISKHIAESLGGEIILESESGKGTRAFLRLPLAIEYSANTDHTPKIANAKLAEGEACRVLVVEDDPASRDLLINLLRNMGCETSEAHTGKEGLNAALAHKPDIIFTDIRMPELTGTEMLKELRTRFAKDDLPVVAVSASSLEHERTFYLAEGFHEFIGKPYDFRDIYAALQKLAHVKFVSSEPQPQKEELANERSGWNNKDILSELRTELLKIKTSLSSGDVNSSKKMFNLLTSESLGTSSHKKISTAIKQYDLVLAERYLDELIAEIDAAIPSLA